MKLVIAGICIFCIANIYYDGEPLKTIKSWEKYYKMAAVAFAGLSLYLSISKSKREKHELIRATTGLISTLPIDQDSGTFITNLLGSAKPSPQEMRMRRSGGGTTKRSVSETKKKYVAASQDWKCGDCQSQLSAWFEVDHINSLQNGGSNNISNLVALCRECHGKKTSFDAMNG